MQARIDRALAGSDALPRRAESPRTRASLRVRQAPVRTGEGSDLLLNHVWVMIGLDAAVTASGFTLGYAARYVWRLGGIHEVVVPIAPLMTVLLGALAVFLTMAGLVRAGTYRRRLSTGRLDGYLHVAQASTVGMAAVIMASAALQQSTISRLAYLYAWLGMIGLLCLNRVARRALLAGAYRQGRGIRRVLVVGATPTGKMVMQNLAAQRANGYQLVGFIGDLEESPSRFGRFAALGTLADLDRVLVEHAVDEVIVALPSVSHTHIAAIFAHCEQHGVPTKLVPDLFDLRLARVRVDGVAGIPLIDVQAEGSDTLRGMLKRTIDILVAGLVLAAAAPLMTLTALAIRLDSDGPILFRQERLGKGGVPFRILKFRSMHTDAERQLALLHSQNEASGPLFKMRRDPRVTRVGRIIRKLSIDELPQLWNVLRGDMSLVGPRPPLAREVAQYADWHRRRLEAVPGMTCLWAVNGRSALDFEEMVMLDLYYIDNWSLGLDLRILLDTAMMLLRPAGAY